MKRLIIALIIFLISNQAFPADHYICVDSAGSGTGADWTNAWTSFSAATWTRGDTYYVCGSDTTYSAYNFNKVESGATPITIKKAMEATNGGVAGWIASYGTKQAIIKGGILFRSSYWVFDGVTGSDNDVSSYGFRINEATCDGSTQSSGFVGLTTSTNGLTVTNLDISHVAIVLCGPILNKEMTGLGGGSSETIVGSDINVSNCYFSGCNVNITWRNCSDCIINNNYFNDNWSSSANHGGSLVAYNCDNLIVKNNLFKGVSSYVLGTKRGCGSTAITPSTGTGSGISTSLANGLLTDYRQSWSTDDLVGKNYQLRVIHGSTSRYYEIIANTSSTITVLPAIMVDNGAVSGDSYMIVGCWGSSSNIQFYNNIIIGSYPEKNNDGVINSDSSYVDTALNMKTYNNTWYKVGFYAQGTTWAGSLSNPTISKPLVSNNLFYMCCNHGIKSNEGIWNNNAELTCTGTAIIDGINGQVDAGAADPFLNKSAEDFRLVSGSLAIDSGLTLGALYQIDRDGSVRPQGSAWDIGAYEFRSNTSMMGVYNVKGMSGYYNANGMVGIAPN